MNVIDPFIDRCPVCGTSLGVDFGSDGEIDEEMGRMVCYVTCPTCGEVYRYFLPKNAEEWEYGDDWDDDEDDDDDDDDDRPLNPIEGIRRIFNAVGDYFASILWTRK